jgi:hypothetical protein
MIIIIIMIIISHHDYHRYGLSYRSVAGTRIESVPFIKNTAVPQVRVSIFSKNLGTTSKFWAPEGWHEASSILRTKIYIIRHGTQFSRPDLGFVYPCLVIMGDRCWPGYSKAGTPWSTTCPGYLQKAVISAYWILPNWYSSATLTHVFTVLFFLSCKANARV